MFFMLRKIVLALLLFPSMLFAQTKSFDVVSLNWLSLIDAQHYSESWESSGDLFRNQISKSEWVLAVSSARESVGNFESRSLDATEKMNSLPNVPDGDYVVVQYKSVFSGKKATETLTLTKNTTGWHVIGYFIN